MSKRDALSTDLDRMQLPELRERREQLMIQAREMASSDLAGDDLETFTNLEAEIAAVQERAERLESIMREYRAGNLEHGDDRTPRPEPERAPDPRAQVGQPPLLVSDANLARHADAISKGSTFGAIEERANLTVATDTGSPGSWGTGSVLGPTTLRAFAGIPNQPLTGATAQMPSLTLPTAAAGVAEGSAHGEFDTVDVANLSTLRYGRWSQVTSFVQTFTQLGALNQAHAVGIARDLNLVDIGVIQTAGGSVTAFDASNLDRNVRQAILKVAAATLGNPEDVVVFGTSAAMGVVTGYTPASGEDRGSVSTRIYGAKVYVTESATAGNIYCFHPAAFQTFSTGLNSASVLAPDSGLYKFGSWIHSTAPGVFIVGGAAGVDVVTP